MRLIAASAAGLALPATTRKLAAAVAASGTATPLLWWNAGGDDQNLLTLLGQSVPGFLELVTERWDVQRMEAALPTDVSTDLKGLDGAPIVVIERLPPLAALDPKGDSPEVAALRAAKTVVLLGTDACYGGLSEDPKAIARLEALCDSLKTPVIRLPGVPVPPHHLVGVLAHLDYFGFPRLDAHGRPLLYYGEVLCTACERRADLDSGRFAAAFGSPGCLLKLGCKGLVTRNSCSRARWNDGENWCVGGGGPCTGCSEPGYPDHGGVGLYGRIIGGSEGPRPPVWGRVEQVGYGVLGVAGVGLGVQAVRRWLRPDGGDADRSTGESR